MTVIGAGGGGVVWGRTEPIKTIVLRSLVLLECENGFAYTITTRLKARSPPHPHPSATLFSENRIKANL